jgi:hypothetical protein
MSTYVPPPGSSEIFVVESGSDTPKSIFHQEGRSVLGPQWSARGDAIVFGIGTFGAFFNGFHELFLKSGDRVNGGAQIAMINPDGSGFREITSGPNNNAFPSLAPDGRRVVYLRARARNCMMTSTRRRSTLTSATTIFRCGRARHLHVLAAREGRLRDLHRVAGRHRIRRLRRRRATTRIRDGRPTASDHPPSRNKPKDEVLYTDAPHR